jgi:chaperone BCS1
MQLPKTNNDKYVFTQIGLSILNDVRKWMESKNWFLSRNIPWRRGILLHSLPGMGKSSLVLEIAKEIKLPLVILDITTMDNAEFCRTVESLPSECILLMEDFERVFEKDKNILKSNEYGGLTFDCILNRLSGAKAIKNVFIFITVNDISKVDPALTRPGRMDRVIELPPMNTEEKRRVASVILKDKPELVEMVLVGSENLTNASFENKCIQVALDTFWNQDKIEK